MLTTPDFTRLEQFMQAHRARLEAQLNLAVPADLGASPRLADAMRYAALGGGKRIRPVLTYAACALCGGTDEQADAPAVAVELIHAYSLVHDDLPAMDDDDLRRGRATCHIAYDEATAILAGDTLQTRAFEVLASGGGHSDTARLAMVRTLAHAAGAGGMAGGQMQDMQAHGQMLTLPALEEIHYLKTGRLITAALVMGALAAGAPAVLRDTLRQYGDLIGLAFQIQDDILDVTAATEQLGKPSGSDERHGKSTFPGLIGLEASRERAAQLCQQAHALLDSVATERDVTLLKDLASYIVARTH
ncbi:geranylgeranyl pyrophosphate synthetase [Isoalcanivorax pacificus W11-5]|uniref:Geranylgeranyl pyrophosphate synthetase n=1 Tax=Isoalcanivorax pacificus W11-5 TaxID=391936 RepID=A0A0B4XSV5_9GAMM|nr:farnesyl diphosphate synthase [Isoalcanivorax pacificus]AJD49513.1 geranylgeranyl pyrophosphate synthetase [Isoalcanivorax pacificus W11-5]